MLMKNVAIHTNSTCKPSDISHPTYYAWKSDADAEYVGRVKIAIISHIGSINFMDPVSMRRSHEELMKQVRNEAIYINNKYKVQLEPFYFEWERLIPPLEKGFPDILSEMLSHNSQQQHNY